MRPKQGTRKATGSPRPRDRSRSSIEGLNIAKRHTKPRQTQGRTDRAPKVQQGGILDIAQPMDVSKVMLVCPSCKEPTRVRHTVLDDGRRVRVCSHCGKAIEVTA